MPLLSVLVPVFNEEGTVREIVKRIQEVDIDKEIIMIDDYSTDGTREILKELEAENSNIRVFFHERNKGKGAAVRFGIAQIEGELAVI